MSNTVTIIDYGAGNIQSVLFALERLDTKAILTSNPSKIAASDRVIFPGVGHAAPALLALKQKGLDKLIPALKQPVLGICLGMQLMCAFLEENNEKGLGIFSVDVTKFSSKHKVPHIGWNTIETEGSPLFKNLPKQSYMYFVHSYFAHKGADTIATTTYGESFSASLHKNNFYGCQFHPEKSGVVGEQILRNFLTLN